MLTYIQSLLLASICTLFVLINFERAVSGEDSSPGMGTWTNLTPAPSKRTEVTASAVNNIIYVIGGFSEPSLSNISHLTVTNKVEAYDPSQDQWIEKAPLPAHIHHAGSASIGNDLYVVGGYQPSLLSMWKPSADVFRYDPATNRWEKRTPLMTPRGALAVTVLGQKIYAVGGMTDTGNSGALEMYDPVTNRWEAKSPMPTPRDHLAAVTLDGRLYAIGGRLNGDYGQNMDVVEVYDPASDSWTTTTPLPTPRSGIGAVALRGAIYVVGGESPEGTFRTNEMFIPQTLQWQPVAPMPTARHGVGVAVVKTYCYVLMGGPKPGGSYSNIIERYEPESPIQLSKNVKRASPQHVGSVMAVLATLQEAGVLPPESTPDANRVIRALIQFQSAFMKSSDPHVEGFLQRALAERFQERSSGLVEMFRKEGWTSYSLEAIVDYSGYNQIWSPGLLKGLAPYNIGREDMDFLSHIFREARTTFVSQNQNIHTIFAKWRNQMPGRRL